MVYRSLQLALANEEHLKEIWKNKPCFRVCCIGGGPGSDAVGLTKFLRDTGLVSTNRLECSIFDRYQEWEDTWKKITQSNASDEFPPMTYFSCDMTRSYTGLSMNELDKIRSADIISFVKFCSTVADYIGSHEECGTLLYEIFRELKPGALVLYIDNRYRDRDEEFKEMAEFRGVSETLYTSNQDFSMPVANRSDILTTFDRVTGKNPNNVFPVSVMLLRKPSEEKTLSISTCTSPIVHTEADNALPEAEPNHTEADNTLPEAEPNHTEADNALPQAEPIHTEADNTLPEAKPIHTEADTALLEAEPIHTEAPLPAAEVIHTEATNALPEAENNHTEADNALPQAEPMHTEADNALPEAEPMHTEADEALLEAEPTHTEAPLPAAEPIHTEATNALPEVEPTHTEADNTLPEAKPIHTEADNALPEAEPIHTEADKALPEAEPMHTEADEALLEAEPIHTEAPLPAAEPIHNEATNALPEVESIHTEAVNSLPEAEPMHTEADNALPEAEPFPSKRSISPLVTTSEAESVPSMSTHIKPDVQPHDTDEATTPPKLQVRRKPQSRCRYAPY
ncbi:RNA polymerase II degradation factor 1-like [Asterias rubens]|uniref:RNA polymerase II degradation factor 1-like n=1 Tax=Asterias rubens TaxID=7604 RepID=UPI001455372D|nr:RNA polymerase II degradation factor 1-like [Asterias rubens]